MSDRAHVSDRTKKFWPFSRGQTVFIVALLFLFAIFAVYLQWNAWAERLIQAEIDAAHARGEFILLEEFPQPPPVLDDQNAATFWLRAADASDTTEAQDERARDLEGLGLYPPTAPELALLRDMLSDRQSVWRDVASARAMFALDWQVDPTAMLLRQPVPEYNRLRSLSTLLSHHALVAHADEQDASVIDDARTILQLSAAVEKLPPSLVTHLVAIGISAGSAAIAERCAPDLAIASGASPRPGAAAGTDVRALIDELLDESELAGGLHLAMQGERAFGLHFGPALTVKPVHGTIQKIAVARLLKWELSIDLAGREPNYPAAQAILAANPPPPEYVYGYVRSLPSMLQPGMNRILETQFRIKCDRRLAALALAIRWYQCDHDGKLPTKLDELVPKYLPSVPLDPFAPAGRAFVYAPDAGHPMIYSVGVDGVDDGGSDELLRKSQKRSDPAWDRWMQKDAILYLVRIPRLVPATQPQDD
ncbi:hypothetical protein BH09PLA1_BH09PLA1_34280 [soil metagenome]